MSFSIQSIKSEDNSEVTKIVRYGLSEIENDIYHELAWNPFLILSSYLISLTLFWVYNAYFISFLGPVIIAFLLSLKLLYCERYVIKPGAKVYNEDLKDMFSYYTKEGHYLLVARQNGRIVGCGGFAFEGVDTVRLKRLFLSPDIRRQGLGTKILQILLNKAQEQKAKRAILETSKWQISAKNFYIRSGFHVIQTRVFMDIYLFPTFKYTQFIMERIL